MKISHGLVIICLCLILAGLAGTVDVDSARYDKSVSIFMHMDNGKVTTKSTELYYGTAPNPFPTGEGFRGELIAADGSIVKKFTVWDPRVRFGDVILNEATELRIQGIVDRQSSADFFVIFPFDRKVTEFRLYDSAAGTLLVSENLNPLINSFFASYPDDPDNPATFGSKTPVTLKSAPGGTIDPAGMQYGQLLGLLSIISGIVLILSGAVISVRFLQKKQKNILIVDGNSDFMEVIAGMLRAGGYTSRIATTGRECFEKLDAALPDLILMDIGMEPENGWKTLQQIKKNPATRDIPVIMLTAQKITPGDVKNYGVCIEDYVEKPVSFEDLNSAIAHVFERRQSIKDKIAIAKGAGVDRDELCECARLTRTVDVNKRLWDLLVNTYDLDCGRNYPENENSLAIKNIEMAFRAQRLRLEQINRNLGYGARG
jgi:two-component system OmpR family response regulator